MTNLRRASYRPNRLLLLSLAGIVFLLVFKFQLGLYWVASAGKMISGFDAVTKFSWKIFAYGSSIYFMIALLGLAISRRTASSSLVEIVEHRIFYAVTFVSAACVGAFFRFYLFKFDPLSGTAFMAAVLASLLISLTIKMDRNKG